MDTGIGPAKPLERGQAPLHAGPSMMAKKHKLEQERIAAENQKLLQRIQQARTLRQRALRPAHAPNNPLRSLSRRRRRARASTTWARWQRTMRSSKST